MKQIIIIIGCAFLGIYIYGLILNPSNSIREASSNIMVEQVETLNQSQGVSAS